MKHIFRITGAVWVLLAFTACSIPNLETPECVASRPAVREFYSFHFGNERRFDADMLELRSKFLTPEFRQRLANTEHGTDPFTTGTNDFPKAFRAGECRTISPEKTEFNVLIFWRDEDRTEQRNIVAEAVLKDGSWLIDNVKY